MKWIIVALALGLPLAPALADDAPDCANAQSQNDMTLCAQLEYGKADKALNAIWPKIKAAAEDSDKDSGKHDYAEALLASQKAWLAYRDAQCKWLGFEGHGGSIEPMLVNNCLAAQTEARIKELNDWGLE
ncbi:lysozyme inhibitor LprI family protein [Aestuariivirga litoralis]|uniref:lysozyme inhibitor LprI family protein n=1 Tax=Aestuariivirga litoralis TaxID=2650924 RepID=UPI0018C66913|nr:lysozyme inhibitor LprI family protein [Aestuariivirga litoralis]MBG1233075.1 DUF1311 domain-containing protein [Aestuariivirga litoralis]